MYALEIFVPTHSVRLRFEVEAGWEAGRKVVEAIELFGTRLEVIVIPLVSMAIEPNAKP